jgi:tetratricopeptide (TPR) repeat protein
MKCSCLNYLCLLAGLAALPAGALSLGEKAFLDGNEAYLQTNYSRAVQFYDKALHYKYTPGALYYNLGNAYYRQGKLGHALAAYRRALRQLPRDGDLHANLATARAQASDGLPPRQPSAALRSFLFVYYYLSLNELLWIAGVLLACIFLGLSVYAFTPSSLLRRLVYVAVLAVLVFGAAAGVHVYRQTFRPEGVVIADEARVRNSPSDAAVDMFALHAGTEFAVQAQQQGWVKIDVDGKKGWVMSDDVEVL